MRKTKRNIARNARTTAKNQKTAPAPPSAPSKPTEPAVHVPTAQAEGLGNPPRNARPPKTPIAGNTPGPQDCRTAAPKPAIPHSLTPSPLFGPNPCASAPGFVPSSHPTAPANASSPIFASESKPSSLSPHPYIGANSDRAERNRQNAQHSTGPRTPEGKAASSQNACKHGLSITRHVILEDEDPALFARLHEEVRAIFEPQSKRESLAVEDIAHCRWALRRFDEAETNLLDYHFAHETSPSHDEDSRLTPAEALAFSCIIDEREPTQQQLPSLQLLLRYRRHWERRHKDALAEFDRGQRSRRADAQAQRQAEAHALRQQLAARRDQRQQQLHDLRTASANQKQARPSGFVPSKETAASANGIPQAPSSQSIPHSPNPNPCSSASGFIPSYETQALEISRDRGAESKSRAA